ncbi:YkoF family thiamine/hydroxymethylpyrimidine-binding protein [Marinobacter zhejiangensis]|uniref:Thiamine-binding protein n=1 Tax=Marinobacter zhejiangensis TaxID=488535 RepID=A0A1I4L9T5_9GAMM|nr:YkoF family thiamine/hydroxymethylpyrimidine-binding protein [Marinobacter zhejiangensis]SFL87691.1 Thiamine-binding protein [Marinobacter zhejiangensis]
MYLSVQLSYYPLTDDYKPPIKEVIAHLQASGLEVYPNRMSTQVFGEFDEVMRVLSDTLKWSFERYGKAVFVANFLEGDRRPRS